MYFVGSLPSGTSNCTSITGLASGPHHAGVVTPAWCAATFVDVYKRVERLQKMKKILLQTTIPYTKDDWSIERFSILADILSTSSDDLRLSSERGFASTAVSGLIAHT